jgi:hypothetical protein
MHTAPTRISFWIGALLVVTCGSSWGLPVYGEQTNESCASCHIHVGELTPRGRKFKLLAYAEGDKKTPIDAMATVSSTRINDTSSSASPAVSMPRNGSVVPEGGSVFITGKFGENLGGKIKWTANILNTTPVFGSQGIQTGTKVGSDFFLDASEIRTVSRSRLLDRDALMGVTLNNAPAQEDLWVSTPVNSFPYKSSQLANAWGLGQFGPTTIIDGGLSSQTVGINAFAFVDDQWYVNVGNYWGLSAGTTILDVAGQRNTLNKSFNPYYRVARTVSTDDQSWMVGFFGLNVSLARDPLIPGSSSSTRNDVGVDAVYQKISDTHSWTMAAVWIHEAATWGARSVGRNHDAQNSYLNTFKAKVGYNYLRTYDASLFAFQSKSSQDNLYWAYNPDQSVVTGACNQNNSLLAFCSNNGTANTSGWGYELMYRPYPKVTLAFQQTFYRKFLGDTTFVDNSSGNLRNAKDNNLSYFYVLYAY